MDIKYSIKRHTENRDERVRFTGKIWENSIIMVFMGGFSEDLCPAEEYQQLIIMTHI